jgi:hypothetical protein
VPVDTTKIFGCTYNWTTEREERIGGDELWNKKQPDGARQNILGQGLLCQTVGLDKAIEYIEIKNRQINVRKNLDFRKTENVWRGEHLGASIPPVNWVVFIHHLCSKRQILMAGSSS